MKDAHSNETSGVIIFLFLAIAVGLLIFTGGVTEFEALALAGSALILGIALTLFVRKRPNMFMRVSNSSCENELTYLSALVENSNHVFMVTTAACDRVLFVNGAFEKIFGRSRETLYSAPNLFYNAVMLKDRGRVTALCADVLKKREITAIYEIERPDGTTQWLKDHRRVVNNAEGRPFWVIAHIEDFTDVHSESYETNRIKARDEALLASIGEAVIAVDMNGMVMYLNEAAKQLFNHGREFNVHKPFFENWQLLDVHENPIPLEQIPLMQTLKKGTRMSCDVFYVGGEEKTVPIAITTTPIIADGNIIGAVAVIRDITIQHKVDRAKSEFVSLASHQLLTPLSTINWYAEMLLAGDGGALTNEQKDYAGVIHRSARRMVELVDTLLNISRMEMGTFKFEPKQVDVGAMVSELLTEMNHEYGNKNISSKINIPQNMLKVMIDEKLLRLVLQNLFTNAFKYTPAGGHVVVDIELQKDALIVRVSDDGYGIPKAEQEKIFTKFYRAENIKTKDVGGTGLGLYMVRMFLNHIGGEIAVVSKENKGSTFTVRIPVEKNAPRKAVPAK